MGTRDDKQAGLWRSVTDMSMLKNTSTFWTKDCCLHFIVESCVVVGTLFMQAIIIVPAILQKRQKDCLAKEGIKCLAWLSQSPEYEPD